MAEYNLNLAVNYVPDWGAWEVAREIICNAMDEDPEMRMKQTGSDILEVWTSTVPNIAQLFVVGEGSKRPGGDTIGQFGEGLKMAALAATRIASQGGTEGLVLRLPDTTVRFRFKEVLGVQTLHALMTKEQNTPGFTATIHLPNVKKAHKGKIKHKLPAGPFGTAQPEGMRIFCKGVYIATLKGHALWDWNLPELQTNRDRAMVNDWETKWALGTWLAENMDESMAHLMIEKSDSIEAKTMEHHSGGDHARRQLHLAFKQRHGERAVLRNGQETDIMAARKGHQLVLVEQPEMRKALERAGIQTSAGVVSSMFDFETVDTAPYQTVIDRLRSLDQIIKAPVVNLRVFAVRADALLGYADISDGALWLSEQLFREGSELQLVATYLHEMAHFLSGALDASLSFENSLDQIAGCLGVRLLWGLE